MNYGNFTLTLMCLSFVLSSCSPDPDVKGKPLSSWTKSLHDQDSATVEEALNMISLVEKGLCERAKEPLRSLRESGRTSMIRGKAAAVYFTKFDETDATYIYDLFDVIQNGAELSTEAAITVSEIPENSDEKLRLSLNIIKKGSREAVIAVLPILKKIPEESFDALIELPDSGDPRREAIVRDVISILASELEN